jgi:hypothetical protein
LEPTPPPLVADDSQPADATPVAVPTVTGDTFYTALAPYGNWVVLDGYGRCWQPGVTIYHHDWQPYGDHGHWVYTDSGWYWISDYSWGWAPFHYGRWIHNENLGWCWCPDIIWGPSWVTWRYSDDYCGWAPLPPGVYYQDGVGFVFNGGVVDEDSDFGLSPDYFIFVTINDFCDPHPEHHRLKHDRALEAYHQTASVNHFGHNAHGFVNHGIDPTRITRITHTPIHPVSLHGTTGVAGRLSPGEPATRGSGGAYASRPESADGELNHPATEPNSGRIHAAQSEDGHAPEPAFHPAQGPEHNYPPATPQHPACPTTVYHPATPAPEPRQVEPRQVEPRQVEPRQVEPRQVEPRQVEPRQVEPRQVEPRQVEPRQVEPKPEPRPAAVEHSEPKPAESHGSPQPEPESSSKSKKNGK